MNVERIAEYRAAVTQVVMAARVIGSHDLPGLLAAIETSHAVGPMLDPTLYRDAAKAMDEDADVLRAAMPLYRLAERLERKAATDAR